MKTNQAGIDLIKSFESCKLTAYKDIIGVLTQGWGHTGGEVIPGSTITQEVADDWLMQDIEHFERGVSKLLTVNLNENQFSALVSFAFNLGLGALGKSTLLKLINQSKFNYAADEFPKWCKAGGVTVEGLLRRRNAEKVLFLS